MTDVGVRKPSGTETRFIHGYIIVAAAFCIMLAIWGTYFAFGVFFKPVLDDFGWTSAMTSGAFSLSIFLRGLLGIIAGGANDRFGPRIVLTLCGILIGFGYLLMSLVSSVWQLYLFYGVFIGIGLSGFYVPLLSTVARWFTGRRSMMTGIVLVGMSVGSMFIPPVAHRLISIYDWRTSYIILGIFVLFVSVLGAQLLKRDPQQIGRMPYGYSEVMQQGSRIEKEGYTFKESVKTRQFWMVCAMFLCRAFLWMAIMVHIVPHAINLGISSASAANILVFISGGEIMGRVVFGVLADRIGNRQTIIIAFVIISIGLFWLIPVKELWLLYLLACVLGFSQGGAELGSPLIAELFGLRSHGLIFGVIALGYSLGAAIGPLIAGYIFDVTGGYSIAFLICAAMGITGLISTVLLKPVGNTKVGYNSSV